jgi:acylpyruvate hydrolase
MTEETVHFINFEMGGLQGIGVIDGDRFRGLTCDKPRYPGDLTALIRSHEDLSEVGRRLLDEPAIDLRAATLLPPVVCPRKILCVGLNYEDHVNEAGLKKPDYPEIFARFATSLIGHGAAIVRPPESDKLDYEAELAVVIGLGGRRIMKEAALDHIAGYSIFNDATLRDYQMRTPQWTVGKNFDRTGAFGPWLVTPDALPLGAEGLHIRGRLNGRTVQDSNTSFLIFNVATLIALLSDTMTLEPGDVIITGTPGGIGASRNPPLYMRPGDIFEVEIERIGTLSNPIADEVGQ